MSITSITGSITGTGASPEIPLVKWFNFSLSNFGVATIALERSFDGGSTWVSIESFTADVEKRGYEAEHGIKYRINCTAYTSGTINYRLSR